VTRWDYFPMSAGPCAPAADVQGGWQITSYFGGRIDPISGQPGSHGGQDLAYHGCQGAELYAPGAGTLSQGWDPSGGGNWSGITLDDGSYVGLGHAASFAPGNPYRRVAAGELIAYCDSTGGSTGDHVHVAYRPAGSYSYADPYDLLADSQHRIQGDDMPLNNEDLDKIHHLVQDVVNDALTQFYTGSRAVTIPDDPGVYELSFDAAGRRVRRLIPTWDEIHALRYVDAMAEADWLGTTRHVTHPAQVAAIRKLPVVYPTGAETLRETSGEPDPT
jgi:murein DD-endopeptidase MepM/ murein hydrolase activator NlpD